MVLSNILQCSMWKRALRMSHQRTSGWKLILKLRRLGYTFLTGSDHEFIFCLTPQVKISISVGTKFKKKGFACDVCQCTYACECDDSRWLVVGRDVVWFKVWWFGIGRACFIWVMFSVVFEILLIQESPIMRCISTDKKETHSLQWEG